MGRARGFRASTNGRSAREEPDGQVQELAVEQLGRDRATPKVPSVSTWPKETPWPPSLPMPQRKPECARLAFRMNRHRAKARLLG